MRAGELSTHTHPDAALGPVGVAQTPSNTARRPSINIKQEESGASIAPKQEQDVDESAEREPAVTDADVQLLLEFRSHVMTTPARPSTPPTQSRVSIAALMNPEDVPVGFNPISASAPPRSVAPTENLAPPPAFSRARSASPTNIPMRALPPLATISPRAAPTESNQPPEESPLTTTSSLSDESAPPHPAPIHPLDRATQSMSISVEPEPEAEDEPARPAQPAPPPSSSATQTRSPPKPGRGGKPRGRVSKGPKKRKGKGWIIESCTTSGVPSDAEVEDDPEDEAEDEVGETTLMDLDTSRDVFGGDSDLTDLESEDDTPEPEYDPGLAGLPPVPLSSDSEYDPLEEPTAKVEVVDAELPPKRNMRRNSTQKKQAGVNFGAFQVSERSSVRLVATNVVGKTRSSRTRAGRRSAEEEKEEVEEEGEEDAEGEDEDEDAEGEDEEGPAKEEKARRSSTASASASKRVSASRGRVRRRGSGRSQTVQTATSTPEPTAAPESVAKRTATRGRGSGRARGVGRGRGRGGASGKGKGRDMISETSSVSMGEWVSNSGDAPESGSVQDEPKPKSARKGAASRSAGKASKVKLEKKDSDSSLTELSEESVSLGGGGAESVASPSLGGTASLAASSPSLGGTRPLSSTTSQSRRRGPATRGSKLANTSARSDGGVTHVSESIGNETHVSETAGEDTDMDVDVEGVSRELAVRDFEFESGSGERHVRGQAKQVMEVVMPVRRNGEDELEREEDVAREAGSSHRTGESSSAPHRARSSSMSHLVGSSSKSHRVAPHALEFLRFVSPVKASGSRSSRAQQVYVLLPAAPGGKAEYREAETFEMRASYTREEYGYESGPGEEEDERWERDAKGKGKGKGKQRGEPPSKKMRVDADEEGRVARRAKGKGKQVDRLEAEYGVGNVSERRPRRSTKPTMRAMESAQQEREWSGSDQEEVDERILVEVDARPVLAFGSRASEASGSAMASGSTKSGAKRRRESSTVSRPPKRSKTAGPQWYPTVAGGQLAAGDLIMRPQTKRCFHYDHNQSIVPRCLACRKKKIGDTCRFVGIRSFRLRPGDLEALGVSFDSPKEKEDPEYQLPLRWNIQPEIEQITRMQEVVARALLPVLRDELTHAQKSGVIWRETEIEVRATCDVCATSMFSSCHMCTHCGRELCGACFQQVEIMCPQGTLREYGSSERKDPQLHKFRSCAAGRIFHLPEDFRPITRFTREELQTAVREMEALAKETGSAAPLAGISSGSGSAQIANWASRVTPWNPTSPQASTEPPALSSAGSSHDVSSVRGTPDPQSQMPSMPTIASPTMSPTHEGGFEPEVGMEPGKRPVVAHQGRVDPAGVPSHAIHYFPKDISEETFKPLWAKGEAVVVQGLLDAFKIEWTPEYFIQEHGEQTCLVVDCEKDKVSETTVEAFFEQFGKKDRGELILKLKDWPARADFRDDFPSLFEDFMNALPIPNYTRRDGILNIASHFAINAIAPDLGPKMYNAFASSEAPGGQGSTRMHMDMADAVNIMMYASDCADGSPGVAAWDIFRACDSDKIRSYLRRHFEHKSTEYRDPIHSQLFYLDSDHRRQLYEEEKVFSWRIYQRPGEAVFIPAGCAHQVCNLADCIKVAIDFVSLENIDRCEKLTAEFRNENDTFTWKEDVLQLRTMMMYAWRSTTQLRNAWDRRDDEDGIETTDLPEEESLD